MLRRTWSGFRSLCSLLRVGSQLGRRPHFGTHHLGRNGIFARSYMLLPMTLMTLLLGACDWGSIGYNKGYAPEQPIAFSHELHAGNYKIQCLYCHGTAERAAHSSIPPLNVCMNCHLLVATDKPAIQKMAEAYNNNKPIAWTKVHMLPDFVKFNHKRHVQHFGAPMACHKCHGPVESMDKMYQYSSLSMGWCVNCHRDPANKASVTCSTCHY